MPGILVLPDLRLNGIFARMIRAVAIGRNLPITTTNYLRPMLQSDEDAVACLRQSVSSSHMREMRRRSDCSRKGYRRLQRRPSAARHPYALEEFLALEAGGWKGKKRSALVTDRLHMAFAREAISTLPPSTPCVSTRSTSTENHRLHRRPDDGRRGLYLEDRL